MEVRVGDTGLTHWAGALASVTAFIPSCSEHKRIACADCLNASSADTVSPGRHILSYWFYFTHLIYQIGVYFFWDRLETLIAAPFSKTEVTLSQFWGYLLLNLIPVELYLFVLSCYSNRHALPSESTVQRSALREIARLLPHSHSVPGKLLRKRSALSQRNCRFMHVFRGENWECVAGEPQLFFRSSWGLCEHSLNMFPLSCQFLHVILCKCLRSVLSSLWGKYMSQQRGLLMKGPERHSNLLVLMEWHSPSLISERRRKSRAGQTSLASKWTWS